MMKILAIDDINDNLISLKAIIRDAFPDSIIHTALNGSKGIDLAITEDPDVILLDIVMPDMDGFEVCRRLKQDERVSDIPVVFITALKGDKENRIKALDAGAEAFLSKPIDETELTAQIRAMAKIKTASEQKRNENERLKRLVEERTIALQNELRERTSAEEALRESEALFRNIFTISPDAVTISDIETGKYVDVNPSFGKLSGFTREEILMKTSVELGFWMDKNDRDIYINLIKENGSADNQEVTFRIKDGSLIHTIISSRMITISGKSFLLTSIKDITERKHTEAALRERESLLRTLVESAPFEIWARDKYGFGILQNKRNVNHFGSILGKKPENSGLSAEVINLWNSNNKRAMNGEILNSECIYLVDGTEHHFHQILAPIIINESIEGITGFNIDITERKIAEEKLKESEAQFKDFFEKASDAIFIAEIESGIIVDANIAASRLLLMPYNHIIGLHHSQLHPKDKAVYSNETFTGHTLEAQQKGSTHPSENEVVRSDGSLVPVEILAAEVTLKGKHCLMGTFRDISARKQTEQALQESEFFFRESQHAAFIGSYKYDLLNDSWTSSEVLEQIFGIDKSYSKNFQRWLDITHPDDREMMNRYFNEEVLAKRKLFNKEYRIIRKSDDEIRWVLGLGKLNFDAEDNIVEIMGTIQDITERKLADESLLESNELNNSLMQTIPFGMDIVDEEGNTLFISKNMEKYFGPDSIGNKCWNLYRDDKTQCSDCPLHSGINIGNTDLYESNGVFGGRTFQISHTGMVFRGKKAMLEIFQDITEKKEAETELIAAKEKAEESDRLKSAFLANMSHEIRTPLNSIIGFSELMSEPDYTHEQQFQFARFINVSGNNLLTIISDIMDISKIEAGQVQVKKTIFSVNQLIIDIEKEYSFKAIEKGIELGIDLPGSKNEIFIETDKDKLKQILVNFVGNALKFTSEGYIEIAFKMAGDAVQFQVKDTGIGISAEFHQQIFERFRQVEPAHTRKYGGNGLGLPISKALIELLGGTIWLESEQGVGSTFYFKIPK